MYYYVLKQGEKFSYFFMPKNQIQKEELKVRVMKLKHQVDMEGANVWKGERELAHKYLNKVLDIINEYRY